MVAPLSVYDSSHKKVHVPPTVCLSHSISPFSGASSSGQLWAIYQSTETEELYDTVIALELPSHVELSSKSRYPGLQLQI